MSELKCRYCGGTIADQGNGTGVCESCGASLTMPRTNQNVSGELYNRADYLRKIHDYDGAISAYEHIVAENPRDPEARWSLVLCKYGVEYVNDKRTGSYLPTINRMSLDSILEDRDYLKALEYSEGKAKEEYRRQAIQLAGIQDELEKIVRENENYDAFISFKATDENRKRTRDYYLAQEIYDALSAAGLRVFFSPVSLRSHVGEVYEPYIFAALYSSKVLLLVGTRKEHLESKWVKNEWSRYLFMARTDPAKHILPVYEGMKPEEFPAGIGKMQAISMNTVGALELIKERAIGYAIGQEKRIYVKKTDGEKIDLTNQIRRLQFAVEDGDFKEAESWLTKLRGETEGKLPEIEYPALLVKYKARNDAELSFRLEELQKDEDFLWLIQNGSEEQKTLLSNLEEQRRVAQKRQFEEEFLHRLLELYKDGHYQEIVDSVERERRTTVLERDAEIDDVYRQAKQKADAENLLQRYRETVGDGETYFLKQLEEKYPQEAKRIIDLFHQPNKDDTPVLSKLDRAAGIGWLLGLAVLAAWLFLKDRLTIFVLVFDLALSFLYAVKFQTDKEIPDRKALSPRILLKSFLTLAITLIGANFIWGLGTYTSFFAQLLGSGPEDDGLFIYLYLIPLLFMILWGIRIWFANKAEKKRSREAGKNKKELLDFLKQFEAQEQLFLQEKFEGIDERNRIPLRSVYDDLRR